ncbi:MAG: hypothetical protein J0G96_10735 [Flavobacteriia bacterium]|nr:hypothetical protein [Flavobacteriia bacterium]OJX34959.1 MAG: hypothetical protein BGO87_09480 [Flavobacteriia bacterium 40-80]
MNDKITEFPQFRKLSNEKHFYKILSEREFEEIRIIGITKKYHVFEVQQYPELLRIKDMLEQIDLFPVISEQEWESQAADLV